MFISGGQTKALWSVTGELRRLYLETVALCPAICVAVGRRFDDDVAACKGVVSDRCDAGGDHDDVHVCQSGEGFAFDHFCATRQNNNIRGCYYNITSGRNTSID